ncbi:AraC family transcriptional regulator [Sphingomonas ginsenosidivorax]|nr:helix-turn-helix transcriptional regulator [Sphingomonas ginsenosidivorax]
MIAPLCGLALAQDPGVLAEHTHDDRTQLIYASRGMVHVTTRAGRWILSPGRALWIEAGTAHGLEVRRPVDLSILYLDPTTTGLPEWRGCKVVTVNPLLRELVATAIKMPWDFKPDSSSARLMRVLIDQLGEMQQAPVDLPEPRDPRAVRVADLARHSPADRTPLSRLAPIAGASTRTIERLFLAETQMSFGAWRQRLRHVIALELLAQGEGVASVSFAVGYENPSSFIASFRSTFGKTPGTYFDPV